MTTKITVGLVFAFALILFIAYSISADHCFTSSTGSSSSSSSSSDSSSGNIWCVGFSGGDCSTLPSEITPPSETASPPNNEVECKHDISIATTTEEAQQTQKSPEERECTKTGCWEEYTCYPFGYVKNWKYCSQTGKYVGFTRPSFVNQSNTSSSCNQNYECKTNVCSDGICVNLTEQMNKLQELSNKINQSFELLKENESNQSESYEKLSTNGSNTDVQIEKEQNLVEKIFGWFGKWFK